MTEWLAVISITILATISPGPDFAMVSRNALSLSRRAGMMTALGIGLGVLVHVSYTLLGIGVLIRESPGLLNILKLLGAAYLVWLGAQMLFKPRRSLGEPGAASPPSGPVAFRRGLLTNLLNPKIGVFYVTFLPQFVPQGANVAAFTFFLVGVHVALTIVWFAGLILATGPLGRFLRRPAVVRGMDRVVGVVFIGFGLKLAASRI